jgi:protocatechuate 4,5-dioxygenase alpha chain
MRHHIEGTTLFDGDQAQKGYALNRMCFSFNSAENRKTFIDDEAAYCTKFALTAAQRAAVKSRNVLQLIEAGGNVYYLAKLAGILGLNVQDIGAQQTGMSVEAFRENSSRQGGEHGAHHRRHRDDPCPLDRQGHRGRQAERSLLETVLLRL